MCLRVSGKQGAGGGGAGGGGREDCLFCHPRDPPTLNTRVDPPF